jgi:hypothetical protein
MVGPFKRVFFGAVVRDQKIGRGCNRVDNLLEGGVLGRREAPFRNGGHGVSIDRIVRVCSPLHHPFGTMDQFPYS